MERHLARISKVLPFPEAWIRAGYRCLPFLTTTMVACMIVFLAAELAVRFEFPYATVVERA